MGYNNIDSNRWAPDDVSHLPISENFLLIFNFNQISDHAWNAWFRLVAILIDFLTIFQDFDI